MVMPIPPDISYGLQCSVEGFDISEDVLTFFYRFNDDFNLVEASDNRHHDRRNGDIPDIRESLRCMAKGLYYRPYNEWYWTKADTDEKAWCLASAVETSSRQSGELVDYLVTKYISDALASEIDPKSRRHQSLWLDQSRTSRHAERVMKQLAHKVVTTDIATLMEAITSPTNFQTRLRNSELEHRDVEVDFDGVRTLSQSEAIKKRRKKQRDQRKVAARSANFLSRVVGKKQTSLFLGGETMTVEGQRFVFSVKKKNIFSDSHGALDISVLEKSSREHLFKLCWYVDKTPALDQITAMVLAVQCGDEDEIVRIGNMFSVQHEALSRHEHLHETMRYSPEKITMPWNQEMDGIIQTIERVGNEIAAPHRGFFDADRNLQDDMTLRLTHGTHEYWRTNADLYFDFHRQCRKRWMSGFDSPLMPVFAPQSPDRFRAITGNTVGRELVHVRDDREYSIGLLTAV